MFDTMLVYTDGRLSRVCTLQGEEWTVEYVRTDSGYRDTYSVEAMARLSGVWDAVSYERIVYLQTVGE